LYFNVFVLVVQTFEKVPSLRAIAPTQKEPPFAAAQGVRFAALYGSNDFCGEEIPPRQMMFVDAQ
jgi:hypothetical protein